jgi:hypothetical protein
MKYQNGTAFRRALEDRLLTQSQQHGQSLVRLRKLVAFDRFLARMALVESHQDGLAADHWLLKGGLALQLRLGHLARTTRDMDVLLALPRSQLYLVLANAAKIDLGDWFTFVIRSDAAALPGQGEGGMRFFATARLDDRVFESFHIDVGTGDPVLEPAEYLTTPPYLAFADIPPVTIPCYPLSQHLAEKVHAYVRPNDTGESSRVKDLVDIVLIADHFPVDAQHLGAAIRATFGARAASLPARLPAPPPTWSVKYAKLADEVGSRHKTLPEAEHAAQRFLDPILSGEAQGAWSPDVQAWS